MFRRARPLLLFLLAVTVVLAVGTTTPLRTPTTKTLEVADFDELTVDVRSSVVLVPGADPGITVESPPHVLSDLDVGVTAGHLTIERASSRSFLQRLLQGNVFRSRDSERIRLRIRMPTLRALRVHHDVTVRATSPLRTPSLLLSTRDWADVRLSVHTECLTTRLSSVSSVELSGHADRHLLRIDDVGTVRAQHLNTQETAARVDGAGDIHLSSTQSSLIDARGTGDVHLYGPATERLHEVSASARLHVRPERPSPEMSPHVTAESDR